jgi:pimeloyl-ACP methyl ester carboxylesterase
MILTALLLAATIRATPPPERTVHVQRTVTVRPGGGDPRRDRPESFSEVRLHPVSLFHALITRPLHRLFAMNSAQAQETPRLAPHTIKTRDGKTIEAELGRFSVPSRRDVKDSPQFELAFIRLKGKEGGRPIVYLAGGPGDVATRQAHWPEIQALRNAGDVLLLDQRGLGMSSPRPGCTPKTAAPPDVVFADARAMTEGFHALAADCARQFDVHAFTTNENADDVDALRRYLGLEKIDLVGFSYGAHLGLAVIRRHGAHIGRAVFAGVEGPDDTLKLPHTIDTQLAKLSQLATGSDALVKQYERIIKKLDAAPILVKLKDGVEVKVSGFGFERILLRDIGDSNDFVIFPTLFREVEAGDTTTLAQYVEKRYRPMASGNGIPLMAVVMDCASGASPERLAAITRQMKTTRFPHVNYPNPDICKSFGARDAGEEFRAPLVSDVPTLFISGTLDSNAPPQQAETVRWGFANGRHLIVINAGHEDTLSSREVGQAVIAFLHGSETTPGTVELPRPKFR